MKQIIITIVMSIMVLGIQAQQKQISFIKANGSSYQIYDESGKKVITTVSQLAVGEVVGWGTDFFVTVDGNAYKIYDIHGKKIKTLSKLIVGKVISVSGNTFTSEDGHFLHTFSKEGKKINTKTK